MLRREIAAFATHAQRSTHRVRSSNVFPLVFQLPAESATLSDCMQVARLTVSHESLPALCAVVADKYSQYRESVPPSIDQRGFKVLSWNVTSLPVKEPRHWKLYRLQRLVRDHIVCLQETKLDRVGMHNLQMLFPQCLVLGSPAVLVNEGLSGGLAVLIPTHLYKTHCTWSDCVPGYAGCAELHTLHAPLRIFCTYLRPGREASILSSVDKVMHSSRGYHGTTLVVGDANALREGNQFKDFLAKHELHDLCTLADAPLLTFAHANGQSALDFIAISAKLTDVSGWTARVVVRERPDECLGHKLLYLTCKPPAGRSRTCHDKYSRLPDGQFCAKRYTCGILPAMLAQHIQTNDSGENNLLTMNAFYKAFATTFPDKHALSASFKLRKAKNAANASVLVTNDVLQDATSKTRIGQDLSQFPQTANGLVRIPRRLRDELLTALNDLESLQRSLDEVSSSRQSLLGISPSLKHWERLRALSPKDMGVLCQLLDDQGQVHTDPEALSRVVLQGREFWMTAPVTISPQQMARHCEHVPEPSDIGTLPFPDPSMFFATLAVCPNTSPGLDGVPYSAYKAAPDISAVILHKVFKQICRNDVSLTPRQLLVWIPKAQAGVRPDNWRPLSMPLVYDRIIDKVVFKTAYAWFSRVLHPSQSLVDKIKEAQFNYCEAQRLLTAHVNKLASTLLVDLSKAFERVNLDWVRFLLKRYQADEWLQNYFSWTFTKRTTTSKIAGRLVSNFRPLVGLDMGRACSVLLFCLSIDPMFWRLQSCQLTVQRAYMDDTTLASPGVAWVNDAQTIFQAFEPLGIVVDNHVCSQFFSPEGISLGRFSSWQRAAQHALTSPHATFIAQGHNAILTRAQLHMLCHGQLPSEGLELLARLCALKCNCKAKTTLIPSTQLTLEQLALLDTGPFGASIIKAMDVTLGLPLASKHSNVLPLDQDGRQLPPGRHNHKQLLATALSRAVAKLTLRAHRICASLTSGPRRALYWTAFCQSTLFYVTSIFALSNSLIKKLQRLQQRVLLGNRTWLPMKHIASVFQAFKIGPCAHVQVSCQKANIAAVLRLYGARELLESSNGTTMFRQARRSLLQFSTLAVQTYNSSVMMLLNNKAGAHTKAYKKATSTFLTNFHDTMKTENKRLALQHLTLLARKSPFVQFSLSDCEPLFAHLSTTPVKALSAVDRFYFLRWLVCAEVDSDYHEKLAGLKADGFCLCDNTRATRIRPFGRSVDPVCSTCLLKHYPSYAPWRQYVQGTLVPTDMIGIPDLVPPLHKPVHLPNMHTGNTEHRLGLCPFCSLGPANTTHWLAFCPIVGLAFSAIIKKAYDISMFTSPATPSEVRTSLIVCVARLRRHLLANGSLAVDAPTQPVSALRDNLKLWFEPHSCLSAQKQLRCLRVSLSPSGPTTATHNDVPSVFPGLDLACPAFSNGLLCSSPPALLAAVPQANSMKKCPIPTIAQDVCTGTLIAVMHPRHPVLSAITVRRATDLPVCEVCLTEVSCPCGGVHIHVVATKHALAGSELLNVSLNTFSGEPYLLVQTDGSYLRANSSSPPAGGLGIIVWKCTFGQPPVALAFDALPASHATDSMHAEALAFQAAVPLALESLTHIRHGGSISPSIVFQLDNLPLVQHFNKAAKCSHLAAARIMASSALLLFCAVHNATVEYIPRESNVFADYAAGVASSYLRERSEIAVESQGEDTNLGVFTSNLPLPTLGSSHPSFDIPRSGQVTLTEQVSVAPCEVSKYLAHYEFKKQAHKSAAQAYARIANISKDVSFQVTYRPAKGLRVYAPAGSGQSLPKEVRLFFFGKDHSEIDMVAAQLHLLIVVATGRNQIGLLTVAEFRQKLVLDLAKLNHVSEPVDFVKRFLNIALNVSHDKANDYLRKHFLFVPEYMHTFLSTIQQHKFQAVEYAIKLGFNPSACVDRNRVYFALEYLEQTFMRTCIAQICSLSCITSIVFIHDGIYVKPCPDESVLYSAVNHACGILGISHVSLRIVNLLPQWLCTFQHLFSSPHVSFSDPSILSHASSAKRRKCAHTFEYGTRGKRKASALTTVESPHNLMAYFKKKMSRLK